MLLGLAAALIVLGAVSAGGVVSETLQADHQESTGELPQCVEELDDPPGGDSSLDEIRRAVSRSTWTRLPSASTPRLCPSRSTGAACWCRPRT